MSARTLERPAAAPVDPRIEARRRSVVSQQRRRRRRRLLAVVVVLGVVGGAWLLTRTGLLDVDRLQVEGAVHESAQDVLDASGIRLGDQLLDIDAGAASRRVEQLPWIDTATVERSPGGSVTVTVTERTPVATVGDAMGGRHLVDASGRLLGPVEGDTNGLMPLEGVTPGDPGQPVEGAQGALRALAALSPGVRSRVSAIAVAPDGAVQLKLVPQGVAVLGEPTDLEAKVSRLATVMGQVDQRDLGGIDVTDPSTARVWRPKA